ncbi:MAG: DNA-processing protein DprA, partial [Actinomycetota bacterium]
LHGRMLGVVGSRNVDEAGAEVAKEAGRLAVKDGLGIVSGAAKGVDRLAMTAALDAGGVVGGVAADSLVRTTKDPEIRRAVSDGTMCICSPYKPTAGFSAANAMGRNKIIYTLSAATLVVATDVDKGGTWAGATEALRQRIAPVLVWTGDGAAAGNAALVGKGATPVGSLDDLLPLPEPMPGKDATQLGLDF